MQTLRVSNVAQALPQGLELLRREGVTLSSRNGPMVEVPYPVTTQYLNPRERVLFCPDRDANPFFHFFESLWMIAGRNDVEFVKHYSGNMAKFSDNSVTLHGAYGFRWRNHFNFDQIEFLISEIKNNPTSRRLVMGMWDPKADIEGTSLDHPCNTQIYFRIRNDAIDMTVCNRSNDVVWGAYGANAVHMSFLLEYMAMRTGLKVGTYYQVSNSFHYYPEIAGQARAMNKCQEPVDYYREGRVSPSDLLLFDETPSMWQMDLGAFFSELHDQYQTIFFTNTVHPMWNSWECWKRKDLYGALEHASNIQALDWGLACYEWLERRNK